MIFDPEGKNQREFIQGKIDYWKEFNKHMTGFHKDMVSSHIKELRRQLKKCKD